MTTVVLVLARTVHIGSAMLLVALPYFLLVILSPAFAANPVGSHDSFCRRVIKWLRVALILEAFSGGVWFWFVTAQMSDQSPWGLLGLAELSTVLGQTQFGWLWLERAVVGVALGVALYFVSPRSRSLPWLVLALSSGLLLSLAWAGHAAAGIHHRALHLFADTLHLLIGAIWPVGLIPMACFLGHTNEESQIVSAEGKIRVLQRFSRSSLIAVLILVATGLINSWLMIGSWGALVTTAYGRLLLGKGLVVASMIGLGAWNRFYLLPRIHDQDNRIMLRTFQQTLWVESGLALVVLLIVGMMGMTSPPS